MTKEPDDLFEFFEGQFNDMEMPSPDDILDVSILPDEELRARISLLDADLSALGELKEPHSDVGRELHSVRAALLIEKGRRGL